MQGGNAENIEDAGAGLMAVIDLGSNSFQMLLVEALNGKVIEIARFREKVQLAAGLDDEGRLQETTLCRAYQCLSRFAGEIADLDRRNVRVVGTEALRRAVNRAEFVARAQQLLGVPVTVISGEDEARLIYEGVIAGADQPDLITLVLDIGGGSTEMAVGRSGMLEAQASVALGCVDCSRRYFPKQKTSPAEFAQAVSVMQQQLALLPERIRGSYWQQAIGTSGTILAIEKTVVENGWCRRGVSRAALQQLAEQVCSGRPLMQMGLAGVPEDRADIFIAGVAIAVALFNELDLEHLKTSPYTLREGLIYAMLEEVD